MKLRKIAFLLGFIPLFIGGCSPGSYPAELRIDGLDADLARIKISTIEIRNHAVDFRCGERVIRVEPVDTRFSMPNDREIYLSGEIVHAPDGPIRFLRLYDQRGMVLLVVENARRGWRLLKDFSIRPGKTIGVNSATGRIWTELEIVSDLGKVTPIRPGQCRVIEASDGKWGVFLVGASVMDRKNKTIANEGPEFSTDMVVFK